MRLWPSALTISKLINEINQLIKPTIPDAPNLHDIAPDHQLVEIVSIDLTLAAAVTADIPALIPMTAALIPETRPALIPATAALGLHLAPEIEPQAARRQPPRIPRIHRTLALALALALAVMRALHQIAEVTSENARLTSSLSPTSLRLPEILTSTCMQMCVQTPTPLEARSRGTRRPQNTNIVKLSNRLSPATSPNFPASRTPS